MSYQDDRRRACARGQPLRRSTTAQRGTLLVRRRQYEPDHELVIDPGVKYTTFLGGNSARDAGRIEVDASGNTYVAGTTQSPDFPTTTGAFRRTGAASNFADAFVTKLNPAGTALVYSTFVGGSNMEFGNGIADRRGGQRVRHRPDEVVELPDDRQRLRPEPQHRQGTARAAGSTTPTTSSSSSTPPARRSCTRHISAVAPTSTAPAASPSTRRGNAYVVGETQSRDFPTTAGAFDRTRSGRATTCSSRS